MHTFSEHYGLLKIFAIYKIYKQEKLLFQILFYNYFSFLPNTDILIYLLGCFLISVRRESADTTVAIN